MKQMINARYGELGMTIGIALLALLFLVFSDFSQSKGASLGPAFFPRLTAAFALLCCALQIIFIVKKMQIEGVLSHKEKDNVHSSLIKKKAMYVAGTFLILISYILLFEVVPYLILTAVFLTAVLYLIGVRRWKVILGIAVIYTVISYYLFAQLLMVQLT